MTTVNYQKTLYGFLLFLSVFLFAGCGSSKGSSNGPVTSAISKVSSTAPSANSINVPIGNSITATFSEAMDPTTINTTTFTVNDGSANVAGTVSYTDFTAVFTPDAKLATETEFTAKISTGAKTLAGTPLSSEFSWSFTTGVAEDTTQPLITLTAPSDGETDVNLDTSISATFDEAMDPTTINTTTFTLNDGSANVSGTVTYSGKTAVFSPDTNLLSSNGYTVTITSGAKDLSGNALAVPAGGTTPNPWTFTTGTTEDNTAPSVTVTDPADSASDIVLSKKIQATFNEEMNPTTINTSTFTVRGNGTPVSGTVTYVGLVATFTPTNNLSAGTTYTATITTEAKDLAGNALVVPAVSTPPNPWTFSTVAASAQGPSPVDLGTSGDFVILSKSGITNTGATAITGDIGVSPIDSTSITGFGLAVDSSGEFSTSTGGPGSVSGKVFAANYATPTPAKMTAAVSDMETAFSDAAGRTTPDFTELGAGNISGMTLAPGLYKWSSGVLIDGSGVTLSGGPNDVWIFQIEGNLTASSSAIVTLAGGAQAKNIFWQVNGGVGVELNTGAAFKGNILTSKAIIFKTGASLIGRALSQTAVTLDDNDVTAP